jgi:hypothetical protein
MAIVIRSAAVSAVGSKGVVSLDYRIRAQQLQMLACDPGRLLLVDHNEAGPERFPTVTACVKRILIEPSDSASGYELTLTPANTHP